METDKIPQETHTAQVPLENEPIHKSLINQKGSFLFILGVVIILVVLGVGGYFLDTNRRANQQEKIVPTVNNQITNKPTAPILSYSPPKFLGLPSLRNKIAYLRSEFDFENNRQTDFGIYVINPDGTQKTQVVNLLPQNKDLLFPVSWSSNGRYIAWRNRQQDNESFEYIRTDVQNNNSILTFQPSNKKEHIVGYVFSPDETKAAVFTQTGQSKQAVYIIDLANNKSIKELDLEQSIKAEASSVRDNFVYWIDPNSIITIFPKEHSLTVFTLNIQDGSIKKNEIEGFIYNPIFTVNKNKKLIAYAKNKTDATPEIWVRDFDGKTSRQLSNIIPVTKDFADQQHVSIQDLTFSERNSYLAYSAYSGDGGPAFVYNLDTQTATQVGGVFHQIEWSPDNKVFIETNGYNGPNYMSVVDFTTKSKKEIEENGDQRIYYTILAWFP